MARPAAKPAPDPAELVPLSGADIIAALRARKPAEETFPVCLNPGLRRLHRAAETAAAQAKTERADPKTYARHTELDTEIGLLDKRVAELAAEIEQASVPFTFRAIGRTAQAALEVGHRPTPEQRKQFRDEARDAGLPKTTWNGPQWNTDTYPPAFIHACLASPELTLEEFTELIWENPAWSSLELRELFGRAVAINATSGVG